jgi:hypothetical protein
MASNPKPPERIVFVFQGQSPPVEADAHRVQGIDLVDTLKV